MGGEAIPAGDHPQWVLAIAEHGQVVVQGGNGTLEGRVGDTILVVPDQALADAQIEIRDKLLSEESMAPALAARLQQLDVQSNPLTSAEEILRLVAEELGFKVPRVNASISDPIHVVLMAARQPGARVRARFNDGELGEMSGEQFIRAYKQHSQGFGEGRSVVVDRVWVPE